MTVNDASLGESGSKLSKVAATSLLMGVTRASSEAYTDYRHSVGIGLGILSLFPGHNIDSDGAIWLLGLAVVLLAISRIAEMGNKTGS